MKTSFSLNGCWDLYYYKSGETAVNTPCDLNTSGINKIKATVPGNVEIDLLNAGVIKGDLFSGMATEKNQKFEDYEWWYKKEFDAPVVNGEKVLLVFGAVDCFAEYYLNGKKIYTSENAFTEQKIDITSFLCKNNVLFVNIKPAVLYAYNQPYNSLLAEMNSTFLAYIRKPAHSFGWDIFPRCISAGIWKDVSIETCDCYNFTEFSYDVRAVSKENAQICVKAIVDMPYNEFKKDVKLRITGRCKNSTFSVTHDMEHFKTTVVDINVKNPLLWWPYGYGDANIYDVTYELLVDGKTVDLGYVNLGIRTVQLNRTQSLYDENHCFKFVINGIDIMCKGSNWVPLDAYHSRDKEKYQKALELFSDTHCNILRVWGGGVYEQEEFYDYCDRHGIMVWQDFMMACKLVSSDEKTMKNFENEAVWVIKKLRNHPSIAVWSGDNEIDESLAYRGRKPSINKITRQLLPSLINQHDYGRAYLESSPYIADEYSEKYATDDNDIFVERHLWGPRDYYKSDFYANSRAHFVSEAGYHGSPCVESIKKIVDSDSVWPIFNEQWTLHSSNQNKNDSRVRLMWDQIKQMFDFEPENIEDFSAASQISQAEAKKFFIERIRIGKPEKSGIIWWNMLDGWPQMSDAVVDYFFEKKLAYHYIKNSQTPFAIMIDELCNNHYNVVATNDTMNLIEGTYKIYDIDTEKILSSGDFLIGKNNNSVLDKIRMMYSEKKFLVIEWTVEKKKFFNHYLCGMVPFDFYKYKTWLDKFNRITNT